MPTIAVNRDELFKRLGRTFTEEEFNDICFEFGIELDEVTTEKKFKAKEFASSAASKNNESLDDQQQQQQQDNQEKDEDIIYRIEIPANRYDLLCLEGLSRALNIFLGNSDIPKFKLSQPFTLQQMIVKSDTKRIRPFVVGAILRGVSFTKLSYNSFIDLQDKLHQNICRKRTLVAIGTHDLDTITGPFYYDAQQPELIEFIPLKQTRKFNSKELLEYYLEHDEHIKPYVPIIKDSPVYPVIYDSTNTILSLPPIINGEHSKITMNTRNILIECTAIDLNRASIVLDTIVCMFSEYCHPEPFTIEPIEVIQSDGRKEIYPKLNYRNEKISLNYVHNNLGISIDMETIQSILKKMHLDSQKLNDEEINVIIPPVRQDILHSCDILEDICIGYGYNRMKLLLPNSFTIGKQLLLNKLTDQLRMEIARCGFTEIFTFSLCSKDDIGERMRDKNSLQKAVKISNPKTLDFQVARTSLIPGILKTIASNKNMPLPLKLFEISDIVVKDDSFDVGARNLRYLSAVYYHKNSGFEIIHGLLDRVMKVLEISFKIDDKNNDNKDNNNGRNYYYSLKAANDSRFLDNRCAEIVINDKQTIGIMGVLHPEVVENFELQMPCSALELMIEDLY